MDWKMKYGNGGEEMKERLWEICNKVWNGEVMPGEWRQGVGSA